MLGLILATWIGIGSGSPVNPSTSHDYIYSTDQNADLLCTVDIFCGPDRDMGLTFTDYSYSPSMVVAHYLGVPEADRMEVMAGWVSVLLALKAAADFGVDLRNHDARRTGEQGYAEN